MARQSKRLCIVRLFCVGLFVALNLLTAADHGRKGFLGFPESGDAATANHMYRLVSKEESRDETRQMQGILAAEPPVVFWPAFASDSEVEELLKAADSQGWEGSFTVSGPLIYALGFRGWDVGNESADAPEPSPETLAAAAQDVKTQRSSSILPRDCCGAAESILSRAAQQVGVPADHCEQFSVVRYRDGESFQLHNDWYPDGSFQTSVWGQRVCTVLVYLNTVGEDEGGQTVFPKLQISVRPQSGAALAWANIDQANEDIASGEQQASPILDGAVAHGSMPMKEGSVKYVVNMFFREKPVLVPWLEAFLVPFFSPAAVPMAAVGVTLSFLFSRVLKAVMSAPA